MPKFNPEHVDDAGYCPFCGSGAIEYADESYDGNGIAVYVNCNDCQEQWREDYVLRYRVQRVGPPGSWGAITHEIDGWNQ